VKDKKIAAQVPAEATFIAELPRSGAELLLFEVRKAGVLEVVLEGTKKQLPKAAPNARVTLAERLAMINLTL